MGMRESSVCILDEVGGPTMASHAKCTVEDVEQGVLCRVHDTSFLADSPLERCIDEELAKQAIAISVRRHAGRLEPVGGALRQYHQLGKNLTELTNVVGTGGVVVNHCHPKQLLRQALLKEDEPETVLVPREAHMPVDRCYVFYAAGLLAKDHPQTALAIMKASLQ